MMKNNQAKVEVKMLRSRLLDREVNYCAILPPALQKGNAELPVLYLLHGLFGRFDNWLTNTKLTQYAYDLPFIIICPEGGDSWYSDSPHLTNHFYESYIFDELIPDVEHNFAVSTERNARAVAGLSMGGYGAFKFVFRHPEMFCFAGSMSGAFHAAEVFDDAANESWTEIHPSILAVFENKPGKLRTENNLLELAVNFPSDKISALPFFYFDCGLEDSFLPVNQNLSEIFRRRGIKHKFRPLPGGHDWLYWDQNLNHLLQLAALKLQV